MAQEGLVGTAQFPNLDELAPDTGSYTGGQSLDVGISVLSSG